MILKAYKYRLYPNKEQAEKLQWVLDHCRELYNAALQERRDAYQIIKQHPNYYDPEWRKQATKDHAISKFGQFKDIPAIREVCPEYQDISVVVLRDPLQRVDKAYQAFFCRVKAGQTPGYPRFQSKSRYDSFTFMQSNGFSLTQDNRVYFSMIGSIKVKLHRPIDGKMKTCTVKREGEHWYVVFACEVETPDALSISDDRVGIDLGLTHFAALSNGEMINNPRHYRKAEKKLTSLQQALSRKKRGSNRRKKAVQAVAKAHRKVRNQRRDFAHKTTREMVNRYQVMVLEDLQSANLSRRPKPRQNEETGQYLPNGASAKAGLNKSINDAGWGMFTELLKVKAAWAGRQVLFVNPKYTSQICSGCGTVRKKDLSERWHSCECGCELDRDINAAVNILRLGQRQLRRE